ncbi:MAG: hypothetical protein ACREYC_01985 [Gammaproteobacteria bacterium]
MAEALSVRDQAAWKKSGRRAGERGGARIGKPRRARIWATTVGSRIAAMIVKRPPQFGHVGIRLVAGKRVVAGGLSVRSPPRGGEDVHLDRR